MREVIWFVLSKKQNQSLKCFQYIICLDKQNCNRVPREFLGSLKTEEINIYWLYTLCRYKMLLYTLSMQPTQHICKVGLNFILQRKNWVKNVKIFTQGHTTGKWQCLICSVKDIMRCGYVSWMNISTIIKGLEKILRMKCI